MPRLVKVWSLVDILSVANLLVVTRQLFLSLNYHNSLLFLLRSNLYSVVKVRRNAVPAVLPSVPAAQSSVPAALTSVLAALSSVPAGLSSFPAGLLGVPGSYETSFRCYKCSSASSCIEYIIHQRIVCCLTGASAR